MKIAVVTDSTAYLSEQEIAANHIKIVPIPVILDGNVYDEGKDITTAEYYAKLRTAKTFPSTSQPPLGEVLKLYENLANEATTPSSRFTWPAPFPALWKRCAPPWPTSSRHT